MTNLNDIIERRGELTVEEKAILRETLKHVANEDPEFSLEVLAAGAPFDGLTKAYKKEYAEKEIIPDLEHFANDGNYLSVAFMDLDHFKGFNDTYGHQSGDVVLSEASNIIKNTILENTRQKNSPGYVPRPLDIATKYTSTPIRYGGEEFLVFFKAPLERAEIAAERVRGAVEMYDASYITNGERNITISVGLAQYMPGKERLVDTIARADRAVYDSKDRGRNLVTSRTYAADVGNELIKTMKKATPAVYNLSDTYALKEVA